MTDTTQPPAETLADIRAAADFMTACTAYLGDCYMKASLEIALREAFTRHRVAALTRRAGGDAIPAGEREGWQKNLAGVKNGSDCYRTIDGVRWFWEPTPPALLKGTGIRHRAAPEGSSFVHPDDIDKLDAHLNGATPKPPAGGDAGAVERAAGFMRHDGLCAAVGAYGYCDCGMEAAKAAALALPAPVVEGDARERFKTAMVDAARARGGAGAAFIADGHTNVWLDAAYDAFAALSEGRSHG